MSKQDWRLLAKVGIAYLLQILSLFFRPLVFVELFYLLALIVLDKVENKICYLFFMLPFYNVFRYGTDHTSFNQIVSKISSLYLSVFLVLGFCVVMFVKLLLDVKNKKKSISLKSLLVWGLFFIAFIIPIRVLNFESLSAFLTITCLFVALYLIWQYRENWNLKKILDIWFVGIILSVVLYFFKYFAPHLNDFLITFEKRRFFIQRDPNYWAFELMTLLCGYTVLLFKKNERLRYGAAFVTVTILGIITYSKSFYISYAVYMAILATMLIVWMIKRVKAKKLHTAYLIVTITLFVVVVVVILFNVKNILNLMSSQRDNVVGEGNFYSKGAKGFINSLTTGRFDIWLKYFGFIVSSPVMFLFGRGVLSGYQYDAIHNTTIQLIYFLGVPTFICLASLLVIAFVKHKNKASFVNFIPLIVLFVLSCSLDLLFSYRTYLILTIIILCLSYENKTDFELATKPNNILFSEKDFESEEVLLSVVIPVYNVEKYLQRCVESLTNQKLIKTEILLIDDGSTDKSGAIADELAERYENVFAFHEENAGASSARNFGIRKAKGKYIAFVDSDDYVENNFTEVYNYLNKDYEMIYFGYIAEYSNKTKIIKSNKDKVYYGNENIIDNCLKIETTKNSPWCKIVKKDFLIKNDLYFNNGFSEDYNWTGRAMCHVNSLMMAKLCYYHYFAEMSGSQMNTYKKSKFEFVIQHSKTMLEEMSKSNMDSKSQKRIKQFVGFNVISNFRFVSHLNNKEQEELYTDLKNNWELIRFQKPIFMKLFILFAKVFGFKLAFKLAQIIF